MKNEKIETRDISVVVEEYLKAHKTRSVFWKGGVFYYDKKCLKPILVTK